MPGDTLIRILVVEGAVLGLAYGLLLGIALRRTLDRHRAAPLLVAARAGLAEVAGGGELSAAARRALAGLPEGVQARLLVGLRSSVRGAAGDRISAIAAEVGLTARAESACASRRWWRRLEGVRLLTVVGDSDAGVPALLEDVHPEVRAAAATWAGDHPREDLVERLIELLDDDAPMCRFAAKAALLRVGHAAVGPLARQMAGLRRPEQAMEVAAEIAEPRLLAPALALCEDGPAARRALAARIAGAVGGEQATHALAGLLRDGSPDVRAAAAAALGLLGHWPAAPELADALADPAWTVRRAAALALRSLGAPGLLLLRESLEHPDGFARDIARHVLELPAPEGALA